MATKTSFAVLIIASIVFFSLNSNVTYAGNPRDASLDSASKSVNVGSLKVQSKNKIHGNVKADKNSSVEIGNTTITNTKASSVDVYTENEAKEIKAEKNSVVRIGNTSLNNVDAGTVKVQTKNRISGKITSSKNSQINIGTTDLNNLKSGKVDIYTNNKIDGNVSAKRNSSIKIGTTSAW